MHVHCVSRLNPVFYQLRIYDGNAEKLADAISTAKFGLMRLNIVGLSGNKIEISVAK